MNVVLFGATGMVGAAALLECVADPRVRSVLAITRSPIGRSAGTDSTERGRTMWARVKGGTENALLALPFKAAFMPARPWLRALGHGLSAP